MRIRALVIAPAALVAVLSFGCQGQLFIEGPADRDAGVHIDWPDGAVAPDGGMPSPPPGSDGGAPPPSPSDGGAPPPPGSDAGPGCPLAPGGECDGDLVRYCDGDTERAEDCASGGQVCEVQGGVAQCVDPAPPPPTACATPIEAEVIALANMARAAVGAGPLTCDEDMARTARLHSQDMCDQGYFSHTGLDGRSPFDRMRDEGVSFSTAGENIARGQRTADQVHTGWMNSPGHRRNILNAAFGRIGVGYVECPSGAGPYWTQVFAN